MDKTATNFMEMDALSKALSETDPRIQGRTQYSAVLIMLVALMGVYARCDTWTLIADYAKCHIPLIRKFLPDVKDTPSHDTIRRFFCIVDTCKLEAFYRDWACGMFRALNEASDAPRERTFRHVAIDGKTICGAVPARDPLRDDESAGYKLHMVSAYLSEEGLSLGQERVSAKHNELEAIPKLIDSLDIGEGDVVTIDAMGTHADIAEAIYRKNAEYLLEVKDNQKLLKEAIIRTFASWGIEPTRDASVGLRLATMTEGTLRPGSAGRAEKLSLWGCSGTNGQGYDPMDAYTLSEHARRRGGPVKRVTISYRHYPMMPHSS